MTFEQKTRTLAAAAGCLAVLGSAVCEAAEEGREAPQEKANKDLPVKVCPSAPRQEAPAMPSLESVIAVWGFPMKMLADGYVEYDGWVGRQEFGTVMAFWKADSRTSAWYGLMNYPEDLTELSLRFKSVSYTHLDVYKRQVLGHGLEVRVVDAVAAERARPEKFGSSVEVGRIFEHDGRVADHRTQDAFDETFGDGRDVLHEVLFLSLIHI